MFSQSVVCSSVAANYMFSFNRLFYLINKFYRNQIQKVMKKRYLAKRPNQTINVQYQTQNNQTTIQKSHSKCRGKAFKLEKARLKTDWIVDSLSPENCQRNQKLILFQTVRKIEGSTNHLKKIRCNIPSNKQNIKQKRNLKNHNSNIRFTFNEFRLSDGGGLNNINRNKLEGSVEKNQIRNSEAKQIRQSIKKGKNIKYRFLSPKVDKFRQYQQTLQSKSLLLKNRSQKTKAQEQDTEAEINQNQIQIEKLIGSGTFGQVFSARLIKSGRQIALKRVKQDKKYKTRQLQIVKMLRNPYIIKVLGTFTTDQGFYEYLNIAMESYELNFYELMKIKPSLSSLDQKIYIYQMLRGVNYMHSKGVCHRDLKPQNMLIKGKKLVICDFGSAKILKPGEQNISYICSRCYRAPELIFQSTNYTTKIDMWSIGCVILEMLNGRPLFVADSSLNHILEVIKVLGTPTVEQVTSMNPNYEIGEYDLPKIKGKPFKKLFPLAQPLLINLIEKLVCYSLERRISALQALAHPYFDQLRQQKVYSNLFMANNFFNFTKQEIPLYYKDRLIPKWLKKK